MTPPQHPLNWIRVPPGVNNPLNLQWMPRNENPPTSFQSGSTNRQDNSWFWRRFGNWQPPVQNVPVRPPSPGNVAGPSNIQPAQQGPRRSSRARQPVQQPNNVYGSDTDQALQQDLNLTTSTFDNLISGQNPQGPSHGRSVQFATGNGDSSYGSDKTVLYEASD